MLLALIALLAAAPPSALEDLLAKGPIVAVEADALGRFASATGLVEIDAPADRVLAVILDFAHWPAFVPKVVKATVVGAPKTPRVSFEIDSPGVNTHYTVQFTLDPATRTIEGKQVHGELEGSTWTWQVTPLGTSRAQVRHVSRARNFSRVVSAFEDDAQTMTTGLNVAGVVTVLRAMKRRCEGTK